MDNYMFQGFNGYEVKPEEVISSLIYNLKTREIEDYDISIREWISDTYDVIKKILEKYGYGYNIYIDSSVLDSGGMLRVHYSIGMKKIKEEVANKIQDELSRVLDLVEMDTF